MKASKLLEKLLSLPGDELQREVYVEGCDCMGVAKDISLKTMPDVLNLDTIKYLLIERDHDHNSIIIQTT